MSELLVALALAGSLAVVLVTVLACGTALTAARWWVEVRRMELGVSVQRLRAEVALAESEGDYLAAVGGDELEGGGEWDGEEDLRPMGFPAAT